MSLYQRTLGSPLIYNYIRPLAVGGIDMSPFYDRIAPDAESVVLDIGCGTGDALRYLSGFRRYFGIDTDPTAVASAQSRFGRRPNVTFESRHLTSSDIDELSPTHVSMAGVLHHLTDDEAITILQDVRRSPKLVRMVTQDIVYLPGKRLNNVLVSLDRGQYGRTKSAYEALAHQGGFTITDSSIVRCHPRTGLAWYLLMTLEPGRAR